MARIIALSLAVVFGIGCTNEPAPPTFEVTDRVEGDRTPRAAECDDIEPARCLLPWPSNTYAVVDASRATGLHLAPNVRALNPRDDGSSLELADGFSRGTPLLALFEAPLDPTTLRDGIHLYLVQPDHPGYLSEVPLRVETTTNADDPLTLLLADPRVILEPNADYLVVVTDALKREDGMPLAPTHGTEVALGLEPPASEDEAAIAGYHAPARAQLAALGTDPATVLRVWDFTTRSADDGRRALGFMRDAAIAALEGATVRIDRLETSDDPNVAVIAIGALENLPTWLDGDRGFVPGPDGLPTELGRTEAPFRVLVPAGEGDYRFVMYGHGTGGNELDDAFDSDLASRGIAKVNIRFYGWTDADVLLTFSNLQQMTAGSFGAAGFLAEAVAHGAAIQRAMTGALGEALAADTLGGMPNPAAGRHPDGSNPMWVGGSLGGTMGVVYASADPSIRFAVVNVPGAAWAQWVWHSATFDLIHDLLGLRYEDDVDLATALTIGQTNLDIADGISWADQLVDHPTAFLVQESMGDPVMPNPATEMVAVTTGAVAVGGILQPIEGVAPAAEAEVIDASAITQFRAPPGGMFDIHGFAARDTPAGVAAREQILEFVTTALFEERSVIAPPASCPDGCDYGG